MTILQSEHRFQKPGRRCASCGADLRGSSPKYRLCRRCYGFKDFSRAVAANLRFLRGDGGAA